MAEEVKKIQAYQVENGAALVTNPATGEILAMIGSKDYFNTAEDGQVLSQLLALEDNDLMDLLIGRKDSVAALEKESEMDSFKAVLLKLRQK